MQPNISKFPQRIVIELTPQCNLACSMCPRHYIDEKEGLMTRQLWIKLIDEIKQEEPNVVVLPFWRGESLLHDEFADLMDYAFTKGIRIHISTNGHLLNRELAQVLSKAEFVTFSVHTQKGYENALYFNSLKQNGKPITQISFVEGETTAEMILPKLLQEDNLGGFDSIRLYVEHTKGGVFGSSTTKPQAPRIFCQKLNDTLVIAYDGSVSRCNHLWITEKSLNAGRLSIKEIWESQYFRNIREHYPDEHCLRCDQWTGHTCGETWRMVDGRLKHLKYGIDGIIDE